MNLLLNDTKRSNLDTSKSVNQRTILGRPSGVCWKSLLRRLRSLMLIPGLTSLWLRWQQQRCLLCLLCRTTHLCLAKILVNKSLACWGNLLTQTLTLCCLCYQMSLRHFRIWSHLHICQFLLCSVGFPLFLQKKSASKFLQEKLIILSVTVTKRWQTSQSAGQNAKQMNKNHRICTSPTTLAKKTMQKKKIRKVMGRRTRRKIKQKPQQILLFK
mmetsp:Transcript_44187/g.86400  ORF Transcript_44187/g.86400 Transcript_44187/m.86400 type:complete len:214 (+) Transcript_44187:2548-3189(+)